MLNYERACEVFNYDPETGALTWRVKQGARGVAGASAGRLRSDGYVRVQIDRKKYLNHRVAWLLTHGKWPAAELDHVNGKPADNRLCNLREATRSENMQNEWRARRSNVSGMLGAFKNGKGFNAGIRTGDGPKYLGYFPSAELAHAAYLAAKATHHPFGEVAR